MLKPRPRKNFEEVRTTGHVTYGFWSGYPVSSNNVSDVENGFAEEVAPRDLCELTSNNDRGPSALQQMQAIQRDYGLSVAIDVQAVQILLKKALLNSDSSRIGALSLIEQKKCEAN